MILIRNARTHNLQGIDLELPTGKLIVITGVSGSGKSSLAFDTLFAEGQRRYLESLALAARPLVKSLPRPAVDVITGLAPAIALAQQMGAAAAHTTVGRASELSPALALLYFRRGERHCPQHPGAALRREEVLELSERVLAAFAERRCAITVPIAELEPQWHSVAALASAGYTRLWHEDRFVELDTLSEPLPSSASLVIDRLRVSPDTRARLMDSLEHALTLGKGHALVLAWESGQTLRLDRHGRCPQCGASAPALTLERWNHWQDDPWVAHTRVQGISFAEVMALPVATLSEHISQWQRAMHDDAVAAPIVALLAERCAALLALDLGHVTLTRRLTELSVGERQRVRLAGLLGATLSGVLYVLDEPSVGLDDAAVAKVLRLLERLRDAGNTVVIVEHHPLLWQAADWIVEIGPGAGPHGGRLLFSGPPQKLRELDTPTARAWRHSPDLTARRCLVEVTTPGLWLTPRDGALAAPPGEVFLPAQRLTVLTGPSGSGKSRLLADWLHPLAQALTTNASKDTTAHRSSGAWQNELATVRLQGLARLPWQRVVAVDQTPIGNSPRATPATFTGIMDELRALFAATPEARARGWSAKRFSHNLRGGRCEVCEGLGVRLIDLEFLPPVWETCPACEGARYNRETLTVRYRGRNIAEMLALSVEEAMGVFAHHPRLEPLLATLAQLGLGYVTLGQAATTLSGGEAQRLKLAAELARARHVPTLYLLDEPTAGLHPLDTARLLAALYDLRDAGHTLVVAEHEGLFLAHADHHWALAASFDRNPVAAA